jgi:ribosomal protein S18 acetylase RimI-like enzyme
MASVGRNMVRDGVTIRVGDTVAPDEYRALLRAVEWRLPDHPDATLQSALATTWNVTARIATGELIGLARVLDDGALYASVWDVIVHPQYQRQGIGRAMIAEVLAHTADRYLVSLVSTAAGEALYRQEGFQERDHRSAAMFARHPPLPSDTASRTPSGES